MVTIDLVDILPKHAWKRYSKRDLAKIQRIVIHHFAGRISIEEAARLHISKGWPGIGYHYVIDLDGTINITQRLDTISYNVGNNNTPTIGIAVRGNWESKLPPTCTLFALTELLESLMTTLGEMPVYGHNDFRNTACPGGALKKWITNKYGHKPQEMRIELWKIQRWWNWLLGKHRHDHTS